MFENHLHAGIERLREAGLRLKPSKCHFCLPQVKGHIVSAEGIQSDPVKLEAVVKYPTPRNIEKLRAFLGLSNYYRRLVQRYAQIGGPLYNLTRKNIAGYKWTEYCEESFVKLKQGLTSPLILAYPKFDTMFTVSNRCVGHYNGSCSKPSARGERKSDCLLKSAARQGSTPLLHHLVGGLCGCLCHQEILPLPVWVQI